MPIRTKEEKKEEVPQANSLVYILYAVLGISIVGCVWFGYSYFKAQKQIAYLSSAQAQQEIAQKEKDQLIKKVATHLLLPKEDPTIYIIEDEESLQGQPIYEGAKKGDTVLVYSQKIIVYDAQKDVLVNVGPVQKEGEKEEPKGEEIVLPLKVEIRNGSKIVGIAQELGAKLGEKKELFEVVKVDKAKHREYTGTLLVNISGKNLSVLEKELSVTPTTLPDGEAQSTADALIILGN